MKLDPLFTIKENKLYKIEDDSLVDMSKIKKIDLPWTTVELESENYNEEFLAKLREELKAMEENGEFAIIVPVVDKKIEEDEDSENSEEAFVNACNHCARRIKDCVSVVGFEIPNEVTDIEGFRDTLWKKHAQYIYFTKKENISLDGIITY